MPARLSFRDRLPFLFGSAWRQVVMMVMAITFPAVIAFGGEPSPTPPPAADGGTVRAWELMRLGRWDEAGALLEPLKADADKAVAADAWYADGCRWQFRRPGPDVARAAQCFTWVVDHAPASDAAPWAGLALARLPDLDVLKPRPREAIEGYRRVLARYPASAAAQEAVLYLAQALWQADGARGAAEAVRELERWRNEHPDTRYAPRIEALLGALYRYPLADYAKAVRHLERGLELGAGSLAQQASTCWTIATLAEHELADRTLAIRYYTRFLERYPNHRTAFMAKQGLTRLGAPVPVIDRTDLDGGSSP